MDQVINIDKKQSADNLQLNTTNPMKPKKKLYLTEGERLRDLMKAAI